MTNPSPFYKRLCEHWAPLLAALLLPLALHLQAAPTAAHLRARSVDPNRAPWYLVATLPGAGPPLARRIAWHRRLIGAILTSEDLHRVPGVGPRRLVAWTRWIRSHDPP